MGFIPTGSPLSDSTGSTPVRHQPRSVGESQPARQSYSSSAAPPQIDAVEMTMQYEEAGEEQEEWRRGLHGLQEWICELLIQNQELRMSLRNSGTNHQFEEFDQ